MNFRPHLPIIVVALALGTFGLTLVWRGAEYLTDPGTLQTIIFLELVLAAVWNYRTRFFPVLMAAFLWAGLNLPMNFAWTTGRWLVLAVAALAGIVIYLKEEQVHLSAFHLVAFACIASALVSAMVSDRPGIAVLKSLSLLLLFLYGAAGAKLAILGRAPDFFSGLLLGCECIVYLTALSYFVFRYEAFGNPNSLGAVMGVVAAPVLLWGIIVSELPARRSRYGFAFVLSLMLLFSSYARAGIAAAVFSCLLLCISARRYRLLAKGIILSLLLATIVATVMPRFDQTSESLTSTFLYKGRRDQGLFASRKSVWDNSVDAIRLHPWMGSGFGTSKTSDEESSQPMGAFASAASATREHGNSYLALTEWVGLVGGVPFLCLLLFLLMNIGRVVVWIRRTGSAASPAVPIAFVLAAGLVHAAFEDWLFAVGYYLCVLFWAFAFVLMDLVPRSARVPVPSHFSHANSWHDSMQQFAPAHNASVS